jgi:DNA modification methylase
VLFNWEYVFVYRKPGKREINPITELSNRLTQDEWKQNVDAVWSIPSVQKNDTNADAAFPEDLVTRLLRMYSCEGDTILDPFSGHGTVAKVALKMRRNAVMYELDKDTWLKQQSLLCAPK